MMRQSGYSLIELMISTVIVLIVLGGTLQVALESKQRAREQMAVSEMQDSARYAMHVLTHDLFMAGYWGCATKESADVANTLRTSAGGFIDLVPITGYEGELSTIDFPVDLQARAIQGNDAFIVRHADSNSPINVKSHNATSATIHLWNDHQFAVGDTLVIAESNCRQIGVFEMSGPNTSPADLIVHNTNSGGGNDSDNCTKDLKGNFVCSVACKTNGCPDSYTQPYGPGSKVMRFLANAYYVGRSNIYSGTVLEDTPILFRQELSAGIPQTRAVEIAQGVEAMDVIYGVDLDSDGEVNQFLSAQEMDLDNSGFTTADEWEQVIAVRISLVFRSANPIYPVAQSQTFNGINYSDRFLRQGFSQTIQLRNHG
jgi:type IV pilus assembly protein PilW